MRAETVWHRPRSLLYVEFMNFNLFQCRFGYAGIDISTIPQLVGDGLELLKKDWTNAADRMKGAVVADLGVDLKHNAEEIVQLVKVRDCET
jgi:hypothetical protein